jgi:hypothetical protein
MLKVCTENSNTVKIINESLTPICIFFAIRSDIEHGTLLVLSQAIAT